MAVADTALGDDERVDVGASGSRVGLEVDAGGIEGEVAQQEADVLDGDAAAGEGGGEGSAEVVGSQAGDAEAAPRA